MRSYLYTKQQTEDNDTLKARYSRPSLVKTKQVKLTIPLRDRTFNVGNSGDKREESPMTIVEITTLRFEIELFNFTNKM